MLLTSIHTRRGPGIFSIVTLSGLLLSCSYKPKEYQLFTAHDTVTIALEERDASYLQCYAHDSLISSWPITNPVFRFLKGDIDNDGYDDIVLGVAQITPRDSVAGKHIFIYQVRNRAILPLWLGTKLSFPLEDFQLHHTDTSTLIRTIEKGDGGLYHAGEYEWKGYGLGLRNYLCRDVTMKEARNCLER